MRSRGHASAAFVVLFMASVGIVGVGSIASADDGANVTTTPIILPSNAANTTVLQNDEPIQFAIPAGELDDLSNVHVVECSDPGGNITAAFLSTLTAGSCDALTEASFVTQADGSLTTADPTDPSDAPGSVVSGNGAVVAYALPNAADLFEHTSSATCDLTDYCIFYIGPNADQPSDGNGVVYSTPFEVNQNYDFLGGSPAPPSGATETVPGAPTSVTATPGDGQVVVGWTPPSSNGDSAITEYVITPYLGGVAQAPYEAVASAVSDTVLNLTPGDSYTFTVEAVNAIGDSLPASSPAAVPLAVPAVTTTTTLPFTPTTLAPSTATTTTLAPATTSTTTTTTTTTTLAPVSTANVTTTTLAPLAVSAFGTADLRGRLTTEITCGSTACTGTLQLYGELPAAIATKAKHILKKRSLAIEGTTAKPSLVLLGSAKYVVKSDSTSLIRLTLTQKGKLWLSTATKHRASAELKLEPSHGATTTLQIVVY